jgi:NTE family protein
MSKALATTRSRPPERRPRIALALGGGGARGLAHILALEALDELGIRPAVIAGTSIGALYGAAYASGMSGREIRAVTEETLSRRLELIRQMFSARAVPVQKLFNIFPLRSALLDPAAVLDLVLPDRLPLDFRDLAIPLRVVATDLGTRDALVIGEGALRPAVAASIAIPVLFAPVVIAGRTLVDGGLVNPLPYDLVKQDADVTIAIDVSGGVVEADLRKQPSAIEVLVSSVHILEKSITREKLKHVQPDVYIDVDVDRFHALEFYRSRDILAAAASVKDAVKRQLGRILESETIAVDDGRPEPPAPRKRRRRLIGRGA